MAGFEDMYAKALAAAEAGIDESKVDENETRNKIPLNTRIPPPTQIPGIETIDVKPEQEKDDIRVVDRMHAVRDDTYDDSLDRRYMFRNIDDNMPNISELTFDFTDSGTVNSWKRKPPVDIENYMASFPDDKNNEEYLKIQRPGPLPTLFSGRTSYFQNQYDSTKDVIGARTIASDQTEKTNNTQAMSDRSRAISQDSETGSGALARNSNSGNKRSNKPERRHSNRSENSNVVDYSEYQNEKKYDWNHIPNAFDSDLDNANIANQEFDGDGACNIKEYSEKDDYILDWNHKKDNNKDNDKNATSESKSEVSKSSETTMIGKNENRNDNYILNWNHIEDDDNDVEGSESNNFESEKEPQNKNINNELETQTNSPHVGLHNDYILDWNHKDKQSAEENADNKIIPMKSSPEDSNDPFLTSQPGNSFPTVQQSQDDAYILDWNHKETFYDQEHQSKSIESNVERSESKNESKNEIVVSDKTSCMKNSIEYTKPQRHDGFVPLTTKQPKHQILSAINTLADSVSSSLSQKKKLRGDEICLLNSASAHGAPFVNLDENLHMQKQSSSHLDSNESQSARITLKSKDSLIFSLSDSDPSSKTTNISGQYNSSHIPETISDPLAGLSFDNTNQAPDDSLDDPFLGLLHQSESKSMQVPSNEFDQNLSSNEQISLQVEKKFNDFQNEKNLVGNSTKENEYEKEFHKDGEKDEKNENGSVLLENVEKDENDETTMNDLPHHFENVGNNSLNFQDISKSTTDFANLEYPTNPMHEYSEKIMNIEENINVDISQGHSPEIIQSETSNLLHIPSLQSPERIRAINTLENCSEIEESKTTDYANFIYDTKTNSNDDINDLNSDENEQYIPISNNLEDVGNSIEEEENKDIISNEQTKAHNSPDWEDLVFLDDTYQSEKDISNEKSGNNSIDNSAQDTTGSEELQDKSESTTSCSSMLELTSSKESGNEIEPSKPDSAFDEESKKDSDDLEKSELSTNSMSTYTMSERSNAGTDRDDSGWEAYVFLDENEFNYDDSIDENVDVENKSENSLESSSRVSSYIDSISSGIDKKNVKEQNVSIEDNRSNDSCENNVGIQERQELTYPPSLDASADEIPKIKKEMSEVINMFNLKSFDDYESKPSSKSKASSEDDSDSEESNTSGITEVYRQESNRISFGIGNKKENVMINEAQSESSASIGEHHNNSMHKAKDVESVESYSIKDRLENEEVKWTDERKPEPELEKLISDFNSVTSHSISFPLTMVSSNNSVAQISVDNTTNIDDDNTIASCAGTVLEKLITDFNSVTKGSLPRELVKLTSFRSSAHDKYNDIESKGTCNSIEEKSQEQFENLISRFNDPDSNHSDVEDEKSKNTNNDESCKSKTNSHNELPTLQVEKLRGDDRRKVFEEQRRRMRELSFGVKAAEEKIEVTKNALPDSEARSHDTDEGKEVISKEMNEKVLSSPRKNDETYNKDANGEYDKVEDDLNNIESPGKISSLAKKSRVDTKNTVGIRTQRKQESGYDSDEHSPKNQPPEINSKKTSVKNKVPTTDHQDRKEDSHPLLNTIHEDKPSVNGDNNVTQKKSDSTPAKKKMSKMKKMLLSFVLIVMIAVGICLGLLIPQKRPLENDETDFGDIMPNLLPTQYPSTSKDDSNRDSSNQIKLSMSPSISLAPSAFHNLMHSLLPSSISDTKVDDWLFTDDNEENTPSPTVSQTSFASSIENGDPKISAMNDTNSVMPSTSQHPSISGFPSFSPSVSYLPSTPSISPFPSISFAPVYKSKISSAPTKSKVPTAKNIPFMNIIPTPTFNNVNISHKAEMNTTNFGSDSKRHRIHKENVTSQ